MADDEFDWFAARTEAEIRHMLRDTLSELTQIENILAGALEFHRSPGGPDDPNGGGYIIGDHTAVTLAMFARDRLREFSEAQ